MLNLKNPFARSTPDTELAEDSNPAVEPAESSGPAVNELTNAVKRWQLERGRTRKRLEELTEQLQTARADLAPAMQAHGAALYEGKDSTEEALAWQQAGTRIAALEAAIAVATEKDEIAQAELQQAEQQLLSAAKAEAIETMMELALQTQLSFSRVKQQRIEMDRQLHELVKVRALDQRAVTEILDQYAFYSRIAHRPAGDDLSDSGSGRKYRGLYHCVAYLCGRADP